MSAVCCWVSHEDVKFGGGGVGHRSKPVSFVQANYRLLTDIPGRSLSPRQK